jgi:HAMP domain-containing protein
LTRSAEAAGGQRALQMAMQVGDQVARNTARGLAEMQRVVDQLHVQDLLDDPAYPKEGLVQRLQSLTAGVPTLFTVIDAAGRIRLSIDTASRLDVAPPAVAPSTPGIGPLQRAGDAVFSDISIEIRAPAAGSDGSPGGGTVAGHLILRRVIQLAANTEQLARLREAGGTVAFGNRSGDVWTDLSRPIARPPIGAIGEPTVTTTSGPSAAGGPAGPDDAAGARGKNPLIVAAAPIDGTPWAVVISLPKAVILAPARATTVRLAVLAILLLIASAAMVMVVTGRAIAPLNELTVASEAMAGGRFDERVRVVRDDEIGRLALSFNTMAARIADSHHDLEERVRQRTERLQERTAASSDTRCVDTAVRFIREKASRSSIRRPRRLAASLTSPRRRRSVSSSLCAADCSSSVAKPVMWRSGARRSCDTE